MNFKGLILSLLLVLVLFEGSARIFSAFVSRPRNQIYKAPHQASASTDLRFKVPIDLPPAKKSIRLNSQVLKPAHHKQCDPVSFSTHPEIGIIQNPNSRSTCRTFDVRGDVITETTYSTDLYGRRTTPHPKEEQRPDQLITLGCSFSFGEGVKDHETLAANLARLQSRYQVFNYSSPGWGPGNILAKLEAHEFQSELPNGGEKLVIYLFIDHHLNRLIGSLDLFQTRGWAYSAPAYERGHDGRIFRRSMHLDTRSPSSWFRFLIGQSHLLAHVGVQIPRVLDSSHFQLWADVVAKMREQFQQQSGKTAFYVAFLPNSSFGPTLSPYLDRAQIPYLDYGDVQLQDHIDGPAFVTDGHPSAEQYEFLAQQILRDLKIPTDTL